MEEEEVGVVVASEPEDEDDEYRGQDSNSDDLFGARPYNNHGNYGIGDL